MNEFIAQVPDWCQETTLPSTGLGVVSWIVLGALSIPLGFGLVWLAKRQPIAAVALLIIGATVGAGAHSASADTYPSCPDGYEKKSGYTTTTTTVATTTTTTTATTTTTSVPDTATTQPEPYPTVPYTTQPEPYPTVPYTTQPEPYTTVPYTTQPEPYTTVPYTTQPEPYTTVPYTTVPEPTTTVPATIP